VLAPDRSGADKTTRMARVVMLRCRCRNSLTIIEPPPPCFLYVWQGKDLQETILDVWQPKELARAG
jgi:hypothetical protein